MEMYNSMLDSLEKLNDCFVCRSSHLSEKSLISTKMRLPMTLQFFASNMAIEIGEIVHIQIICNH